MLQGNNNKSPSSAQEGGEKASSATNDDSFMLNGFDACSALLAEDDPRPNWETLQAIEARRRCLLEQGELPVYRIMASWDGTCLQEMCADPLVWMPVIVFFIVRLQAYIGIENPASFVESMLDSSNIDILGGFVAFLLVLFVNQTNERFWAMYQLSKRCCGLIQDTAGLVTNQFPPTAVESKKLLRYMNAAHIAGYVGLGGPYSKQHFFNHLNQEHNLLNKEELAELEVYDMDKGSATFKTLCTWCQREVVSARKAGHIDSYEAVQLQNRMLNFRAAMDGMYDFCEQPTQFFYIHFLILISTIYLPLFAVSVACGSGWGDELNWKIDVINGTVVVLQAIFVVGLRLLAQKMIDPYGTDLEDLSVISYIYVGLDNSNIIMSVKSPID
mmetsp:Transcript_12621/g.14433  ORF Transcript_12621/g.14433 Transcript_12621/m.14433 type:complete len:386 (-) Transcript_12621:173-1330(-)